MDKQFDNPELEELRILFNVLDSEEAIFMSHYQLAEKTGKPASLWKQFLLEPSVATWIAQEISLFKEFQLKQMIRNATDNDKSVGAAQMINSLTKTLQENTQKTGPIIIYTHVPLTEDQRLGSVIESIELDENILKDIPEDWRDGYE